ncbi:MAG TPA: hypothetical protein VN213_04070, partial [Solirubrobacteraceae bacterium]|nr:hypothetical protein [Solirubrobacteraceae bacterium]
MRFLRSLLARVGALPPLRLDALLAGVLAVELALEILVLTDVQGSDRLLAFALASPVVAGVALRRRAPLLAVPLTASALPSGALVGPALTDHVASPFFCMLLVAYTAGTRLEGLRLAAAFVMAAGLAVAGVAVDGYPDEPANFVFSVTLVGAAPMLFGQLMRSRAGLNRALRDKAARAEAEQARRAEAAAL